MLINCLVVQVIFLLINAVIPIYMILLNYINKPINNMINKYYVNDAKKILKSMPNLKIITITGSYGKTSTKNYLAKRNVQHTARISPFYAKRFRFCK